jgi:multicomponent Na+:H+ antiporter subunit B
MILIDLTLFAFLIVTAIAIARLRNLFAVAMLAGLFSLLSAGLFVTLDAVDVAFTEAAVGGGVSTIFMLGALALMPREEKRPAHRAFLPLALCFVTGAALVYGTFGMPAFGSADAPIHLHVAPDYIARAQNETGVPNIVTAVLASYRGYDTLGETTVIFVAAISVLMLLGFSGASGKKNGDD